MSCELHFRSPVIVTLHPLQRGILNCVVILLSCDDNVMTRLLCVERVWVLRGYGLLYFVSYVRLVQSSANSLTSEWCSGVADVIDVYCSGPSIESHFPPARRAAINDYTLKSYTLKSVGKEILDPQHRPRIPMCLSFLHSETERFLTIGIGMSLNPC